MLHEHIIRSLVMPLKYTTPKKVFYCIECFEECFVGVFGDGDNASYEWFVFNQGQMRTSNDGYGIVEVALRDALLEVHPLEGRP